MRWTISSQHRDFFQRHLYIEFDSLLSPSQIEELYLATLNALKKKLKCNIEDLSRETPEAIFLAGRDLWFEDPIIKKYSQNRQLARIASELLEERTLRFVYTQQFLSTASSDFSQLANSSFSNLVARPMTLEEMSAFQDILCGLMICLHTSHDIEDAAATAPFPQKTGQGIFFHPSLSLDLTKLYHSSSSYYLLIVYGRRSTVYILQPKDPHVHSLKKLGYVFGDRLKDNLHPILLR